MLKKVLVSLSAAVVLVILGVFVFAQVSGGQADQLGASASPCAGTEAVMTASGSGSSDCCASSSAASVQTVAAKSGDCSSGVEVTAVSSSGCASSSGCSEIMQAAVSAGCPGVTQAMKSAGCGSGVQTQSAEKEEYPKVRAANTSESCCEGSETAAMLADACCGNCS